MKRRTLLKSCLAAPFLGLLKKKESKGLTLEKLYRCKEELDKANRITIKGVEYYKIKAAKLKCLDCPDEDGSEFCEDLTCPYFAESTWIATEKDIESLKRGEQLPFFRKVINGRRA